VGLKSIIFVSSFAVIAPVSVESEPEPPSIGYEYHIESSEELVVPVFPNHACESRDHADFLEVASLAASAGFPGDELHTAVAVAYAESLGDPNAVNRNRNGSKDSGLWQINSVHGFSDLKNPLENARAAYEVWRIQGWSAWYAHTPRGGEYGSGTRFQEWLKESKCTIDFYHEKMVYYSLIDERTRGEDARFDALPALR
jgi:hypothetical protein